MSVTLNEAELFALLNSQQGAVADDIRRRAENVVDLAQQNALKIMHRTPNVVNDIDYALDEHLTAFIGIEDQGKQSRYLAKKAVREPDSWLLPALIEGFDA